MKTKKLPVISSNFLAAIILYTGHAPLQAATIPVRIDCATAVTFNDRECCRRYASCEENFNNMVQQCQNTFNAGLANCKDPAYLGSHEISYEQCTQDLLAEATRCRENAWGIRRDCEYSMLNGRNKVCNGIPIYPPPPTQNESDFLFLPTPPLKLPPTM